MKKIVFVICIFFSMADLALSRSQRCQPSKHAGLPSIAKLTYDAARKALLAADWKPLQTVSSKENPDVAEGNGPIFWQRGYTEVEACAGTGIASCSFLFKDVYGNRLRVTTAGEELPDLKVHARVTGLRFVCK